LPPVFDRHVPGASLVESNSDFVFEAAISIGITEKPRCRRLVR
jgi:hypothetical protein